MHELSITQNIVEICERVASGRNVLSVTLEIGELSGVVPEAVEFCFAACVAGTSLERASLVIERIEGVGYCGGCGTQTAVGRWSDPCAGCGAYGLEIVRGEELRVKELEVE
jgi:hydrogenase nickel incorporation protein HypA/HybF